MSRVLLVGESWFTYSVHQKGFDSFYTSEFSRGGSEFVASLRDAGHDVTHLLAHEISTSLPSTAVGLREIADVIVVSDVGANSFQITPSTFSRSITEPDKTEALRQFTEEGGGLLMVGGYITFSGIDAKARWGRTPLAEALPVTVLDRDDRIELPAGASPQVVGVHEITDGLERVWPRLLGLNEVKIKNGARLLATCADQPLLVCWSYGAGSSVAFTSDIAPHWAPSEFVDWKGYGALFDGAVRWLAGAWVE